MAVAAAISKRPSPRPVTGVGQSRLATAIHARALLVPRPWARSKVGGTITAKQVFMTVVAPGAARLHTSVSEKDLSQVKKDQPGEVKAVAFPDDSFQAKVESISMIPSSPGSFECVVGVAGAADSAIMSGMKGSVTIITYDKADAVTVPKSAVFSDDDDSQHVFVVDGDGHRKQPVESGRTKGDNIEIREGLKAGEKILLQKP